MLKIVVITGSSGKGGNSFAMTDAFIRAAEEKGHKVTRFDAAMKKGRGGIGSSCPVCYSSISRHVSRNFSAAFVNT